VVGLGFFAVSNPDKFFLGLAKTAQFMNGISPEGFPQLSSSQQRQQHQQQAPIIIHHTAPGAAGGRGFLIQLVIGAGFCWGSYIVLVTILPEAAKGMFPVSKSHFNRAVTSLGKAVIGLKDTLLEQIQLLATKQDELGDQQNKTHNEVVDIKDNVFGIRGDIGDMQDALNLCQESLTEAERRTSYIARGVQLLTRGVGSILPEDEHLRNELHQFNMAADDFHTKATPLQARMRQKRLSELHRAVSSPNPSDAAAPQELQFGSPAPLSSSSSSCSSVPRRSLSLRAPEVERPSNLYSSMSSVEDSVADVHALMSELGCKVISQ